MAVVATSASPSSPRSWPASSTGTCSATDAARSRTPTTPTWPTSSATAATPSCPRIPGGEITPEKLIVIGEVARDFGLYTKITGGQRIDLFGARMEELPAIWRRLVDAGFESGPRLRQGAAHGEVLRRLDLVPLRRAGLGPAGHRPRAPLPRAAVPAQAQGRRQRMRPRVRRGPRQGLRGDRHREGLEPVRRRQRRRHPCPRPAAGRRPRHRDAGPLPRPVPHVLHPHRRPAPAHRPLGRLAGRWPRPGTRGRRRRRARARQRARSRDGPPRRRLLRRVEGHPRRPGQARPVRVVRQRAGHSRSTHHLPQRARPVRARGLPGPGRARRHHPGRRPGDVP